MASQKLMSDKMSDKEKKIQKALGLYPSAICNSCGRKFFFDESYETATDWHTVQSLGGFGRSTMDFCDILYRCAECAWLKK